MSVESARKAAAIVSDAGGRVVGRTKLQKIGYLLNASGLEAGFSFVYKHYGPYSEDLAVASREAGLLGFLTETEQLASWGAHIQLTAQANSLVSVRVMCDGAWLRKLRPRTLSNWN